MDSGKYGCLPRVIRTDQIGGLTKRNRDLLTYAPKIAKCNRFDEAHFSVGPSMDDDSANDMKNQDAAHDA